MFWKLVCLDLPTSWEIEASEEENDSQCLPGPLCEPGLCEAPLCTLPGDGWMGVCFLSWQGSEKEMRFTMTHSMQVLELGFEL